jgi:hypothetical protein
VGRLLILEAVSVDDGCADACTGYDSGADDAE